MSIAVPIPDQIALAGVPRRHEATYPDPVPPSDPRPPDPDPDPQPPV
jgi:hypothetical protein